MSFGNPNSVLRATEILALRVELFNVLFKGSYHPLIVPRATNAPSKPLCLPLRGVHKELYE
jgi:hypothetical protein